MEDIELTGSQEVLDELQSGRTRELLLLLQDRPVPEVVDPLNIQGALSYGYATDSDGDYVIGKKIGTTAERPADDSTSANNKYGIAVTPRKSLAGVRVTVGEKTSALPEVELIKTDGTILDTASSGDYGAGDTIKFNVDLSSGTEYGIRAVPDSGTTLGAGGSGDYPYESPDIDITAGVNGTEFSTFRDPYVFTQASSLSSGTSGYITDQYTAPTVPPADFKQWNAIRARDVSTGGSTSTNPVEFEILDSSDTNLNSTRIPKSEIAEKPFKLRERKYQISAGSDGQSDYQIPKEGNGGHYGIPILRVITVSVEGSVVDLDNWSFDPTTNTVSIDTSRVTVSKGDAVTISYDFDVFDSTLQPRAYLSREDTSETSPSISHFRYEYVI